MLVVNNLMRFGKKPEQKINNTLYTFGFNDYYKTAQGTSSGSTTTPTVQGTISNIKAMDCSYNHNVAIDRDYKAYVWGSNSNYKTGQNTNTGNTTVPLEIVHPNGKKWFYCACSVNYTLLVDEGGTLYAAGSNTYGQLGIAPSSELQTFTEIGSGEWGYNFVSAGEFCSYVQDKRTFNLKSAGRNLYYATSQNTDSGNTAPHTTIKDYDFGYYDFSCNNLSVLAIDYLGRLLGAGNGASYQFGNNSSDDLQVITILHVGDGWQKISLGLNHAVGIQNGKLMVCGNNGSYRTGLNTNTGSTQSWTQVGTDTDWTWCSAGEKHTLAIRDGKLYAFGDNIYYQTGLGTESGYAQTPTQVGSHTDWLKCVAGESHSLAIRGTY